MLGGVHPDLPGKEKYKGFCEWTEDIWGWEHEWSGLEAKEQEKAEGYTGGVSGSAESVAKGTLSGVNGENPSLDH